MALTLAEANSLITALGVNIPEADLARKAEAEHAGFSLVQLQKSRLAWDSLRKNIQSQLQGLEHSIVEAVRAHNVDETIEEGYEEGAVAAGVKRVYSILDKLDHRLLHKLDEALNAKGLSERQVRHAEAAKIIKEYQTFVESDALLAEIDKNGFTSTNIRAAVVAALTGLATKF
jgi:hypothetical protein